MSSAISPSISVIPEAAEKGTKEFELLEQLQKFYTLETCVHHPYKKSVLQMLPWKLLSTEIEEFTNHEMENLIKGRSRPFNNVIKNFRIEKQNIAIHCPPLTFYIKKNHIRVEMARAECFCRHVFYVERSNFYDIIRDNKVQSLDIQVDAESYEMFEFLALTLPGVWCRELLALNLVFDKVAYFEPLTTLLKKSRNLSRLRVAQSTGAIIRVSQLISSMGCLEELELNCPDNTGSGYHVDKQTMDFIVEQEKRTGGLKPFRSLKVFNATFDFNAEEFIKGCVNLSMLSQNQTYEEYESIFDVRGRGGIDLDLPGNSISFEVTPSIPQKLADELFREVFRHSKSYLINFKQNNPTPKYFMINNCMIRLLDHN